MRRLLLVVLAVIVFFFIAVPVLYYSLIPLSLHSGSPFVSGGGWPLPTGQQVVFTSSTPGLELLRHEKRIRLNEEYDIVALGIIVKPTNETEAGKKYVVSISYEDLAGKNIELFGHTSYRIVSWDQEEIVSSKEVLFLFPSTILNIRQDIATIRITMTEG